MTKPRLTFLHEPVPTNLGFFPSPRSLHALVHTCTCMCSAVASPHQPFPSPHPNTKVLPNIRRYPPYASSDEQSGLPIFPPVHVPTCILARQPEASESLQYASSFASHPQATASISKHAAVLPRTFYKAWPKPRSEAKSQSPVRYLLVGG
jgi:hypothetical protein